MSLLNPSIPIATSLVGIDRVVNDMQMKLDTNLLWLTNAYGRMKRGVKTEKKGVVFYPEIYIGEDGFTRVTPDSKKKGMVYFVVEKEENPDFVPNEYNYLTYKIGMVFWVNLKLINPALIVTEDFTQNLIEEARHVCTRLMFGGGYKLSLTTIEREFREIYKEFPTMDETQDYHRAPYSGFRINGTLQMQEDCLINPISRCQILAQNISPEEGVQCVLPTLDFSNPNVFNALTPQQIIDIQAQLP